MQITGSQAQKILRCGNYVIRRLMEGGILHNLKPPNGVRVYPIFDSIEVHKVAKVYAPRLTVEAMQAALLNGNGHRAPAPRRPVVAAAVPSVVAERLAEPQPRLDLVSAPLGGVFTRLDGIERKIDQLLKLWS